MVTKILTGIQATATDYQKFAREVWIICLCFGIILAIFGDTPAQGALLISCSVIGLPAYFIDQAQKPKSERKGRK